MPEDHLLDHFVVYDTNDVRREADVTLKGQFDQEPVPAYVQLLAGFANPVNKYCEEHESRIRDPQAHLSWYSISQEEPEPTRVVVSRDQFGTQQLFLGKAAALLVPASKEGEHEGVSERLDHYKAYRVLYGGREIQRVRARVLLVDQFGRWGTEVLDPLAFAVPVVKTHGRYQSEIHNPEDHLVVYRIRTHDVRVRRMTKDQFGEQPLDFYRSALLGVPAKKIEWGVAR